MKKLLLLFTLLFLGQNRSFSQEQQKLDSLQNELKKFEAAKTKLGSNAPVMFDSTKVNLWYEIIQICLQNNPDKAMDYAKQCLSLSEQIGYKPGVGDAYSSMGCVQIVKGNIPQALEYLQKSLTICIKIGYKKGIAEAYNNIGLTYLYQGNYPESLKNHLASLKIREEIGDKNGMAGSYHNIGLIYESQKNFEAALANYFKAEKLNKETGNKMWLSFNLCCIGGTYNIQGKYPEALKSLLASLQLCKEINDKYGLASNYNNIGEVYMNQSNYPEALKSLLASLQVFKEIGDKQSIAITYSEMGRIYEKQGNLREALKYETKGLELAREIEAGDAMKNAYKELAVIDSSLGNFRGAFENHKLYMQVNDSMFNMEKEKKLTSLQMQYDFDKKESLAKAENEKELQKQKLVRNGFIGGFAVVLLFAGVFFRQRNKTNREKKISEELLLNILPAEVADEIKLTGTAKSKAFTMVTVMFTDFKDFTTVSEKVSAELLVDEIHTCFSAFDHILQKHKIEKIKTIGDAYLCASGLPVSNYTHATDMIEAAFEIRNFMLQRKQEKEARGEIPFELRIGIHTGAVVAGIVGVKKYAYDIWGDTVNVAARMEQNSEVGKINISGSTYELVKAKFNCTHRGKIQAKNKGEIDMYFVETVS